jgi:hypothetical protein
MTFAPNKPKTAAIASEISSQTSIDLHSSRSPASGVPPIAQQLSQAEKEARNDRLLQDAAVAGVETALRNRKVNTTRAYSKAQKLWLQFCDEFDFKDRYHVNTEKLLLFTQNVVLKITVPPTKKKNNKRKLKAVEADDASCSSDENNDEAQEGGRGLEAAAQAIDETADDQPEGALLKYNSAKGYISAILDLYNQQIARGEHQNPNPRGLGVRGHLKDLRAATFARIRALHEDRAIGTIVDSYSPDLMHRFVEHCWSTTSWVEPRLRTALDFLIGHFFLLRGQLRRSAEFADMFVLEFPNEGSQPCLCWIFIFDNGKANKTGKKQYLGCMRHKDYLLCTQGALAQYLFYRFHIAEHNWPDFSAPSCWDAIKLLKGGNDPTKPLDATTQRKWIRGVFNEIGHYSSKTTHAGRRGGAQWAEIAGVSEEEVSAELTFANDNFS